jgi:hypothetical protein
MPMCQLLLSETSMLAVSSQNSSIDVREATYQLFNVSMRGSKLFPRLWLLLTRDKLERHGDTLLSLFGVRHDVRSSFELIDRVIELSACSPERIERLVEQSWRCRRRRCSVRGTFGLPSSRQALGPPGNVTNHDPAAPTPLLCYYSSTARPTDSTTSISTLRSQSRSSCRSQPSRSWLRPH